MQSTLLIKAHVALQVLLLLTLHVCSLSGAFGQTHIVQYNHAVAWGAEVNTCTGNFFFHHQLFQLPNGSIQIPAGIELAYNSDQASLNSGLGKGWTFSHNMFYSRDAAGNITIHWGDGREVQYLLSGGHFTAPSGTFDSLKVSNDTLTLCGKSGEVYRFSDSTHKQLTRWQDQHGNVISLTYSDNFLSTLADPLGRVINFGWSGGKLRTVYESNQGTRRTWVLNYADDVLTRISGPENQVYQFAYDTAGRMTQLIQPQNLVMNMVYWENGAVNTAEIPASNVEQTYTYDAATRVTTVTEDPGSGSQTTEYQYDGLNRLTRVTGNCCGFEMEYEYDSDNNLTKETDGNSQVTTHTYDGRGNRLSSTDANGNTTTYTYDASDRLLTRDIPGTNDDTYTYDTAGRILTANNSLATLTFTYDALGRVLTETQNGQTTTYVYDPVNPFRTITYPGGRQIIEERTANQQMDQVKEGSTTLVDYTYDALGRLISSTYSNGLTTNFTYDDSDNLTRLAHGANWDGQYQYDANLNPTSLERLHRPTVSEQYIHDGYDRLTEFKTGTLTAGAIPSPTGTVAYSLDGMGNRTSINDNGTVTTYVADNANAYTSITSTGTINPTYDNNGNLTYDGSQYYFYDVQNRLIKASTDAAGTSILGEYQYDALGRRIRKTVGGTSTDYFYDDSNRIIEERTGGTTTTYVYGANCASLVQMKQGATEYFYHQDRLGSVVTLSNGAGTVVEQYEYDVYGSPLFYNSLFASLPASSVNNPYLYGSLFWDEEIDLFLSSGRMYDPILGRFLQRDPLRISIGLNMYEFMLGNPLQFPGNDTLPFLPPMAGMQGGCLGGLPLVMVEDTLPVPLGQQIPVTPTVFPQGGSFVWTGLLSGPTVNLPAGNWGVNYITGSGCLDTIPFVIIPVDNEINGNLFVDANGDGLNNDGGPFPAAAGIRINLFDEAGNFIATTHTGANGDYSFEDILPFNYRLIIDTLPPLHVITTPGLDSDYDPIARAFGPIVVPDFGSPVVVNGGIKPSAPTQVEGLIWDDQNTNGIQDAGEPGVPGVKIRVFVTGFEADSIFTNGSGQYVFPYLPQGNDYEFKLFPPPILGGITGQDQGGNDNIDSDFDANGIFVLPGTPPPGPVFILDGGVKPRDVVKVKVRTILSGAVRNDGEMGTDLQDNGLLPSSEPYSGLGYSVDNPGITLLPGNIPDAVDWITIELRDKNDSTQVVASKSAIVKKDGCVVDPETGKAVCFDGIAKGSYFVAVRHRNHLDIMTKDPVFLDDQEFPVDFTDPNTPTVGIGPQKELDSGLSGLWGGDANGDNVLKFSGANRDPQAILLIIGGSDPTAVSPSGYYLEDTNLDGVAKFSGPNRDPQLSLEGIGGSDPTATKESDLPQ